MERGIILNDGTPHKERVKAGLQWLRGKGGGTVLIPLWGDYGDYFGEKRERHQKVLAAEGIRVMKMGRHMTFHGDVLVLYPDDRDMREVENRERDGSTMVVEWVPDWLSEWRRLYDVDEFTVESGEGERHG